LIIGAMIALVRLFGPELVARVLIEVLGLKESEANAVSVEAAFFLISVAGGFHLIDHLIGCSGGWMRYIASAMEINDALIEYQWEWHKLLLIRGRGDDGAGQAPSQSEKPLALKQFELAQMFSKRVLSIHFARDREHAHLRPP